MLSTRHPDAQARMQAFAWLEEQVSIHGDVLPRKVLERGFNASSGERIVMIGPQGIWKPRSFQLPLSITTSPDSPYNDAFGEDGALHYRYKGQDPADPVNVRLRQAGTRNVPLVYFHGVVKSKYLAVWPVFIVGDDPANLTFRVMADDAMVWRALDQRDHVSDSADGRRAYVTASVRRRLHQRGFRERVLRAYREQCTICRLKHPELLDAAHIIPDSDAVAISDTRSISVNNGLSLCKLHHAAYDSMVLGITPDYTVSIRRDVLEEIDGPMLKHGLVGLHGQALTLPTRKSDRPNRDWLEQRYSKFQKGA